LLTARSASLLAPRCLPVARRVLPQETASATIGRCTSRSRSPTSRAARERIAGDGAAAVAAALTGKAGSGKLACIVSGGNIDAAKLAAIATGGTA